MVPRGLELWTLRLFAVSSDQLSYETSDPLNPRAERGNPDTLRPRNGRARGDAR